jgi:hypothetical protein
MIPEEMGKKENREMVSEQSNVVSSFVGAQTCEKMNRQHFPLHFPL